MSRIDFQQINKRYAPNLPLTIHNATLTIGQGEFCVFVGPSGCGKSTLLRMVAGLEDISSGDLSIGGRRVNDLPPAQRGVAMVFQSYALYPHMTVRENMAFGLKVFGADKAAIEQKVKKAADILQLTPLLDRLPKALSGGQRQRVAIGRAIVKEPDVFLFDEPLSNLDAALRVQTRLEIAKLHHDIGRASMIYVTHDQVEAMTLADKIVVLSKGKVEQVGKPLDLYNKPASLFVAGFIGSPQMNFITGEFARKHGATTVGVRPEHLFVSDSGEIKGLLRHSEKLGNETFAYVTAGDMGDITVRVDGTLALEPGEAISLGFAPEHLFRFDEAGKTIWK